MLLNHITKHSIYIISIKKNQRSHQSGIHIASIHIKHGPPKKQHGKHTSRKRKLNILNERKVLMPPEHVPVLGLNAVTLLCWFTHDVHTKYFIALTFLPVASIDFYFEQTNTKIKKNFLHESTFVASRSVSTRESQFKLINYYYNTVVNERYIILRGLRVDNMHKYFIG